MLRLTSLIRDESMICKSLGFSVFAKLGTCPFRPWGCNINCGVSLQRAAVPLALLSLADELIRTAQQDQARGQPSLGSLVPPSRVPGQYALCARLGDLVPNAKLQSTTLSQADPDDSGVTQRQEGGTGGSASKSPQRVPCAHARPTQTHPSTPNVS